MREKFAQAEGRRCTFTAKFKRFGQKKGFKGYPIKTCLFVDIKDASGKVASPRNQMHHSDCVKLDAIERIFFITQAEKLLKESVNKGNDRK